MHRGYVRLYRKMLDSPIYKNAPLLQMAIHCVLSATHRERKTMVGGKVVMLKPGEFVTGRHRLASELGIKDTTAWKRLKRLERKDLDFVTLHSNNRFTVVSVNRWYLYQMSEVPVTGDGDSQVTAECQLGDTNNNNNHNKNNKKTPLVILDCVPKDEWRAWCDYRRERDHKLTLQTMKVNMTKLGKLASEGQDISAVIEQTIERGWKSFFPVKDSSDKVDESNPYKQLPPYRKSGEDE